MRASLALLAIAAGLSASFGFSSKIESWQPHPTTGFTGNVLLTAPTNYCFRNSDGKLVVSETLPAGAKWLAKAQFEDTVHENGWTFLSLQGSPDAPDQREVAYASGESCRCLAPPKCLVRRVVPSAP
jgi:hypothetical protein